MEALICIGALIVLIVALVIARSILKTNARIH
jgi:hypothetical protein